MLGLKRVVVVFLFGLVWLAGLTAFRSMGVLIPLFRLLCAGAVAINVEVHLILFILIVFFITQPLPVLVVPASLLLLLLLQHLLLALLGLKLGFLVKDSLNAFHFSHFVDV